MKVTKLFASILAASLLFTACAAPAKQSESIVENSEKSENVEVMDTTYQADVVVIGAGGAGMAAALKASDEGASVVILEKMNYAGGNTTRAEGGMNAAETVFQKEKGIQDTVESMVSDTIKGGKELNNPELVQYLAENSAKTIDWLTSIGMDMRDVAQGAGATNPRMHRPADGSKIGGALVPVLMKNLEKKNVEILYTTTAVEITKDENGVTGVVAKIADGNTMTFKANAVVVATGGFGANEALYASYRPDLKGFSTTNHPGATGDGILLAQAVGADTVDLDKIQTNPTVEVTTQTVISESVRGKGAIFVNQSGKRFTSEMLTRDVLSAAILEQPEKYAYLVFDQRVMDSMAALKANYEKGIITKGDDIASLAKAINVDEAALTQTITDWNKAVAQKKDTEFNRETGMDADLSKAPYYAVKVSPAVHYTMGGIKIDTNTQVFDTDGKVIAGLFAAGEVTGGVHGGNRLGGNAVADIMVYGCQAGVQSGKYALEKGKLEVVLPQVAKVEVPSASGNYKDGSYEGSGKGNESDIKVKVDIKNGNIAEITVLEQKETPAIFDGAQRELLPQIIAKQTTEVDVVSGATLSCNGIIAAVNSALEQAK